MERIRVRRIACGVVATLFLLGTVLAVVAAPYATASTPTAASGGFTVTITPTAVRAADGNTLISFTFQETLTGGLSGTGVGSGLLVVHPDGTLNAFDAGTFTGTIAGRADTVTVSVQVAGTFASLTGQFQITNGAGDLANAQGVGFVSGGATGPVSFAGTYTAQVQFGMP